MCPNIDGLICYVGNWSLLIETIFASMALGLALGLLVGVVVFTINRKS